MSEQLFNPADINERFLIVMDDMISEGACKTKGEFAAVCGMDAQNLSAMQKAGSMRSPTKEQIAAACLKFGYSANWLLLGMGPKKLDKKQLEPVESRLNKIEVKMRRLEKIVGTALQPK